MYSCQAHSIVVKGQSLANRSIFDNHFFPVFFSFIIFFITADPVSAQTLITVAEAANGDSFIGNDSVLPILPGVLIAGLALIFAIRERSFAKEFKSKYESEVDTCRTAIKEATRYRAILDNSNVGLWEVDIKGMTLYANAAMCELLGVKNIDDIKNVSDRQLLLKSHPGKNVPNPYQAMLIDRNGKQREVLVSEQSVVPDAAAMSITVRTVVDVNSLISDRKTDQTSLEETQSEKESEMLVNSKLVAAA